MNNQLLKLLKVAWPFSLQTTLITLALISVPLSTTLGGIAYIALAIYALINCHQTNRWLLLIQQPLPRAFLAFFALVLLGLCYNQVPITMALATTKKYLWLLFTPILMMGITLPKSESKAWPYHIYLGVIVFTLFYSFAIFASTRNFALAAVFKDHIIQNLILIIGLAICLYRLIFEGGYRYLYAGLALALTINMLFISDSITGYLLVLMCYGFVGLYYLKQQAVSLKKTGLMILLGLTIIGIGLSFSPVVQNRLQSEYAALKSYQAGGNQFTSIGVRLNAWRLGYHFILQRPLFGYGTGGVFQAYSEYLAKNPNPDIYADKLIDIGYLNVSIQYGLIGLAMLVYFLYQLCKASLRRSPFEQFLVQFIVFVIIVMLTINPWLTSSAPTHLFSLLFALCFASDKASMT